MKETLHYLLMANHLTFQKALLTGVKDKELTPGQPKILDYLRNHNGAVQKEIAEACHIDPATITSVLTGMETKNLIIRKKQDGNRRNSYVYLTEKGREHTQYVEEVFDLIEEKALVGFTAGEKELLNKFLTRIYQNINGGKGAGFDVEK